MTPLPVPAVLIHFAPPISPSVLVLCNVLAQGIGTEFLAYREKIEVTRHDSTCELSPVCLPPAAAVNSIHDKPKPPLPARETEPRPAQSSGE